MEQGSYLPVMGRTESSSEVAPMPRELPFRFTGNASEYFRIWIVNTLLTVVTVGIYSAWAKVRTKQYFYRHTWVDGTSFDYVANPIPILKGRLIAAAALGALVATQHYSPKLYVVLLLLLVAVTPWILVKSLAFNARNSTYRNIRFAFAGRAGEAFGVYFGMMLFNVVTCGFGFPYAEWRMTRFYVARHLFGDLQFDWSTQAGGYYRAYLLALLLTLPFYVVLVAVAVAGAKGGRDGAMSPLLFPVLAVFYVYLLVPAAYLRARIMNLVYGGMRIGPHSLISNQRGKELLKLYVTNALGILFSLGLLIPWAEVRLAAYRASSLTLLASGSLAAETLLEGEPGALGEGLTDLGDFDIGIGA